MAAMVKTALAAMCVFTLLATAYLSASLLILRPPRANYQHWALTAFVIVAQGGLTLIALRSGNHLRQGFGGQGVRYVVAGSGVALAALGASSVYSTLSGPHFEGYALVLGSAMIVQGLLTIAAFAKLQPFRMAGSQQ
jgi:hypothetical protein